MAAARVFLMVACATVLMNASTRAASIFFPGEDVPTPPPQLVFKETPDCAKNSDGLCSGDSIPYPTDLVRKALASSSNTWLTELTSGDEALPVNVSNELGTRFGGSVLDDSNLVEETAVCTASEAIIYPTMARSANKDWLYVVNIEGQVVQGIRVEKCVEENKPCKIGEHGTACRQKFIYRKLLAVDRNEKLNADNFRIPSACVCYVKNDFLLSTRISGLNGRNSTKSSNRKRRQRRQTPRRPELEVIGGETEGLSGSPLDNNLAGGAAAQGTAQQSIETEETLNPSDTIGSRPVVRYAGEIIVHSNPIVIQKKDPAASRRRN